MVNPIGGKYWNEIYSNGKKREKTLKGEGNRNEGVVINIAKSFDVKGDIESKVETVKKLIKEGKYPLDRDKLAEKILQFLTDVG